MDSLLRRKKLIRHVDILNSIWLGGEFLTLVEDSDGKACDFIYTELISNGYTGSLLSSADEWDWAVATYLRGVIYNVGEVRNKAAPKCLKSAQITAPCKYTASGDISTNSASGDSKDVSLPVTSRKEVGISKWPRATSSRTSANLTPIVGEW